MSGSAPERDEHLTRLDTAIRRVHGEAWHGEDARKSTLFGLLTARALYTRPDEARNDQRAQLDEALAGSLRGTTGGQTAADELVAEVRLGFERQKIRPDGVSQRDNVIRALAMLAKAAYRQQGVSIPVTAARRTIAAEVAADAGRGRAETYSWLKNAATADDIVTALREVL
jgi:hypothetical protein